MYESFIGYVYWEDVSWSAGCIHYSLNCIFWWPEVLTLIRPICLFFSFLRTSTTCLKVFNLLPSDRPVLHVLLEAVRLYCLHLDPLIWKWFCLYCLISLYSCDLRPSLIFFLSKRGEIVPASSYVPMKESVCLVFSSSAMWCIRCYTVHCGQYKYIFLPKDAVANQMHNLAQEAKAVWL